MLDCNDEERPAGACELWPDLLLAAAPNVKTIFSCQRFQLSLKIILVFSICKLFPGKLCQFVLSLGGVFLLVSGETIN